MECAYKDLKKEEFKEKITKFDSRFDLRFFLLNILLQLLYNGWYHCACGEKEEENKNVQYVKYKLFLTILKKT